MVIDAGRLLREQVDKRIFLFESDRHRFDGVGVQTRQDAQLGFFLGFRNDRLMAANEQIAFRFGIEFHLGKLSLGSGGRRGLRDG